MQVRFFTVPVHGGGDAAAELNQFLNGHRILSIDRHLVADAANSAWAVCVSFDQPGATQAVPARGAVRADKVDYKEVLTPPQFAVFARLRALRKEMADKEGIPAYALFTNDQMAQIIQRNVCDLSGLREIPGVGEARVDLLLDDPRVRGVVRYMDDLIWWTDDRAAAHETLLAIRDFLWSALRLAVKEPARVGQSKRGVMFCGFRVFEGRVLLSRRRKRCYRKARAKAELAYEDGRIDALSLQAAYASALSLTLHADASAWRRAELARHPVAGALSDLQIIARIPAGKAAKRVIRGGSWNDDARNVRAAHRNWNEPGDRNENLGFRCVRAHARMDFRTWPGWYPRRRGHGVTETGGGRRIGTIIG